MDAGFMRGSLAKSGNKVSNPDSERPLVTVRLELKHLRPSSWRQAGIQGPDITAFGSVDRHSDKGLARDPLGPGLRRGTDFNKLM